MNQLSLAIDLSRCIGCKTCVAACRNYHGLTDHASDMPGKMPYYLRVESRREGSFPNLKLESWVVPCQHCNNAPCVKACKSGSISKDEQTGIVRIDQGKCQGSGDCLKACPYGVIQFDAARNKAHKCDMCWDLVHGGQKPVCAQVCLTDAIRFGEKQLLRMELKAEGKEILKRMSAQSVLYYRDSV
ncbi:4Fe-4S dicluster domain-containing protein [Desulfocurvibacter africanus]|uniref:4Fe-4S dicluster domain-containing protein n=1 Tax=Desulfocurvibacter africanus TaxID=873 RepID=UPI0004156991|nr:4Fe-4S dicluster domain-containing protein [Desulfocurvibacter africanus]